MACSVLLYCHIASNISQLFIEPRNALHLLFCSDASATASKVSNDACRYFSQLKPGELCHTDKNPVIWSKWNMNTTESLPSASYVSCWGCCHADFGRQPLSVILAWLESGSAESGMLRKYQQANDFKMIHHYKGAFLQAFDFFFLLSCAWQAVEIWSFSKVSVPMNCSCRGVA